MTKILKCSVLAAAALSLSGCIGVTPGSGGPNEVVAIGEDRGIDSGSLSQLEAGIYIDPDGCHIWMIDDGLEGYWSRRRDPVSGLPVCVPIAPPNSVVGDFRAGGGTRDWVPRR
jgi:hypothetical protein